MKGYRMRDSLPKEAHTALSAYEPLLRSLLWHRNIRSTEEAEVFLNPSYDAHLHDPFLLPDMERAVERILGAMKQKERIAIYSDYDCDGIPGGVVLHDFFRAVGYENFENYIPHRHKEGYGLNNGAIEELAERGAKLLITVDCGITDTEQVACANELGVSVIVTDHHLPRQMKTAAGFADELPPAFAVINPKRADSAYPFDGLCGGGIAFKLTQALLLRGDFKLSPGREKWWLDMAGLSTLADMVPLVGENRVLANYGLLVLRKTRRPGLQQLFRMMKVDQSHLSEDDVGFMLAPRINAASRMDAPEDAFRLLTATDAVEAGVLASHLTKLNDERKGVVASTVKEIKRRIAHAGEPREVIVMGNPDWRPGLLGLAANSLMEEYERPVFLWGREGGEVLKGSCRSDGSVNVVELMTERRELFLDFGGHKFSGGFSLVLERIHTLEEELIEAYLRVRGSGVREEAHLDAKLSIDDVHMDTYRELAKLAPFGEGNPKPQFLFESVEMAGVSRFGKEEKHLKLSFKNKNGRAIDAIGFFWQEDGAPLAPGKKISFVASLELSHFRGRPELRLRLADILGAA